VREEAPQSAERRDTKIRRILAVLDGTTSDATVVATALELADAAGASVEGLATESELRSYSVSVAELRTLNAAREAEATEMALQAADRATERGSQLPIGFARGSRADAILRTVRERDFDLVVIAHKRSFFEDYVRGSIAVRLVRQAPCAVLVLRR
jgi:nucleotide-binding universal stress UspA family protein